MKVEKRLDLLKRRQWRIRKKVVGSGERPRMSVRFSGKHIYVQFIDDGSGRTLAAATSLSKDLGNRGKHRANVAGAEEIGKLAAGVAQAAGIQKVVFDRSGASYHGKVKALADAARAAGLQF